VWVAGPETAISAVMRSAGSAAARGAGGIGMTWPKRYGGGERRMMNAMS